MLAFFFFALYRIAGNYIYMVSIKFGKMALHWYQQTQVEVGDLKQPQMYVY